MGSIPNSQSNRSKSNTSPLRSLSKQIINRIAVEHATHRIDRTVLRRTLISEESMSNIVSGSRSHYHAAVSV
uniref:Uncharacterized protein n=1 Tax=Rhizophagus irregularis (strain DAOM 181602 / DAOM 197198 / MUCL 43194) TaxID=747089 RepID=U9SZ04_RHIID